MDTEWTCGRCGIDLDFSTGFHYNEEDDCSYCSACNDYLEAQGELNQEEN